MEIPCINKVILSFILSYMKAFKRLDRFCWPVPIRFFFTLINEKIDWLKIINSNPTSKTTRDLERHAPCVRNSEFLNPEDQSIYFFMLMNKLVVKNSRCRDILIRSMLNHECLNKIYLISPYGSETFLTDPPSLAVDFFFNSPPSPPLSPPVYSVGDD